MLAATLRQVTPLCLQVAEWQFLIATSQGTLPAQMGQDEDTPQGREHLHHEIPKADIPGHGTPNHGSHPVHGMAGRLPCLSCSSLTYRASPPNTCELPGSAVRHFSRSRQPLSRISPDSET